MTSALSFDYWDTLFDGSSLPERRERRHAALRRMLRNLECDVPDDEFSTLYRASWAEAERWWREEHRGYTADERIRWMLEIGRASCRERVELLVDVVGCKMERE